MAPAAVAAAAPRAEFRFVLAARIARRPIGKPARRAPAPARAKAEAPPSAPHAWTMSVPRSRGPGRIPRFVQLYVDPRPGRPRVLEARGGALLARGMSRCDALLAARALESPVGAAAAEAAPPPVPSASAATPRGGGDRVERAVRALEAEMGIAGGARRALGSGSFGTVVLAERGGRPVALKIYGDDTSREEAEREWAVQRRLEALRDAGISPNFCPLLDARYLEGPRLAVAVTPAAPATLASLMCADPPAGREAAWARAVAASCLQVALAVHAARRAEDLRHRDLKPANVVLFARPRCAAALGLPAQAGLPERALPAARSVVYGNEAGSSFYAVDLDEVPLASVIDFGRSRVRWDGPGPSPFSPPARAPGFADTDDVRFFAAMAWYHVRHRPRARELLAPLFEGLASADRRRLDRLVDAYPASDPESRVYFEPEELVMGDRGRRPAAERLAEIAPFREFRVRAGADGVPPLGAGEVYVVPGMRD